MIKTESGRISDTQKLHILASVLQTVNVSSFVAFGLPAEYVAFGAMLITGLHTGIGMYLRMVTTEQMK